MRFFCCKAMFEILYEDDDIVAVNKASGLYVHQSPGHEEASLSDLLAKTRPQMRNVGSDGRPGVVHRLDAETSGVIVFAKTSFAYSKLRHDFEKHNGIVKKYLAVVHGSMKPSRGFIDLPIGKRSDKKRMRIGGKDAKRAFTRWEVLGRSGGVSLVEFTIETGRTHQIRVHSAHLGFPIVGDKLYGNLLKDKKMRKLVTRQLLHAVSLTICHPRTSKIMEFLAPPPHDIIFV